MRGGIQEVPEPFTGLEVRDLLRRHLTTLPQGDLSKDPGILRAAAQHNGVNVGVYASVLRGGSVHRGDSVSLVTGAPAERRNP